MTNNIVRTTFGTMVCTSLLAMLALSGCSDQATTHEESAKPASTSTRTPIAPAPLPDFSGPASLTGWPGQDKITEDAMEAALITPERVSNAVDLDVVKNDTRGKPFDAHKSDDAGCNVTQGITSESVGNKYEHFRASEILLGDDADNPAAQVYQAVAAYPDRETAQTQFVETARQIKDCNGKTYKFSDTEDHDVPITVRVSAADATSVAWQLRYGTGKSRCFSSYNGVANVIVQTQVCSKANTRQFVQDMADAIVNKLQLSD